MSSPFIISIRTRDAQQTFFSQGTLLVRITSSATRAVTNEVLLPLPLSRKGSNGIPIATNFGDLLTVIAMNLAEFEGFTLRASVPIEPGRAFVYELFIENPESAPGPTSQLLRVLCERQNCSAPPAAISVVADDKCRTRRHRASCCRRRKTTMRNGAPCPTVLANVSINAERAPRLQIALLESGDTQDTCNITTPAIMLTTSGVVGQGALTPPAGSTQMQVTLFGGGGSGGVAFDQNNLLVGGGGGGAATFYFCVPIATALGWTLMPRQIGAGGQASTLIDGGPGSPGGDTILQISAADGTLLAFLIAYGGGPGGIPDIQNAGGGGGFGSNNTSGAPSDSNGGNGDAIAGGTGGNGGDPNDGPSTGQGTSEVPLNNGPPISVSLGQQITGAFIAALQTSSTNNSLVFAPGSGGGLPCFGGGSVARFFGAPDPNPVPGGAACVSLDGGGTVQQTGGGGSAVAGANAGQPGIGAAGGTGTSADPPPAPGGGGTGFLNGGNGGILIQFA